jgi:hypothetical protein
MTNKLFYGDKIGLTAGRGSSAGGARAGPGDRRKPRTEAVQ